MYEMNIQTLTTSNPQPQQQPQQQSGIDLQSVVTKYQSQPELLKLILASKVEEDKRRTEEAKLKAKELDLYLQQGGKQSIIKQQQQLRRRSSSASSNNSNNTTSQRSASIPMAIRRNSSSLYANHQLLLPPQPQPSSLSTSAPNPSNPYLYSLSNNNNNSNNHNLAPIPRQPQRSPGDNSPIKISRRRRSMQAITKIVETNEFPYDDHHFWKNNGNTIQKKTGCKSVYYKCANSIKGCPVNKTVIEQPDGNYIIKYRGDHIPDCSKVEHIKDL